jgi:hypothetical protein
MGESTILFSRADLSSVLYGHEQKMLKEIDAFDGRRMLDESVDSLCDHFEKEYRIEVPTIDEAGITFDQQETKVDVRRTPNRVLYDTRRTTHVPGTLFTFFVPYKGEQELFKCRPSAYNHNPPHARVKPGELELAYAVTEQNSASIRAQFDRDLAQIRQWLAWVANDVEQFNGTVRAKARARVEARKRRLENDRNTASGIGFPSRRGAGGR